MGRKIVGRKIVGSKFTRDSSFLRASHNRYRLADRKLTARSGIVYLISVGHQNLPDDCENFNRLPSSTFLPQCRRGPGMTSDAPSVMQMVFQIRRKNSSFQISRHFLFLHRSHPHRFHPHRFHPHRFHSPPHPKQSHLPRQVVGSVRVRAVV